MRVWKFIVQQHFKQAEFHFANLPSIGYRIAAGLEQPAEATFGLNENTPFAKPIQASLTDRISEINQSTYEVF